MTAPAPPAQTIDDLRRENEKLRRINKVLMDRVERSTDWQGNAFSLFQAAIVLEGRVKERSLELKAALRQVEAVNRDLTRAKELAEVAELRLREAIETISEGFALFDSDDRLLLWNAKFTDLMVVLGQTARSGMPFTQVVRQAVANRTVADAQGREDDWMAARLAHHHHPERPFVYRLADGSWLQVNERRTPEGTTVVVYTDITDIKQLEERRREVLRQAKQAAEAANLSKTRFLAAASHDLHQPLNAARLFTGALAETCGDGEQRDLLVGIDNALEDIDSLLRALFDISKLDAGVMEAEPVDTPIGPLITQLGREYAPQALEAGLGFRVVPCSLVVRSDPRLLSRILRNLLSNALRYTERGRILLGCRRLPGRLRIEVCDTGIGIPADKIGTVFMEFQQLSLTGRRREKGIGLGLAIVERIARLLDHPLSVRSIPGRGSCFAVDVPVVRHPAGPDPAATPAVTAPTGRNPAGLEVVAIDDDPNGREGLAALLRAWGCVVTPLPDARSVDLWLAGPATPPGLIVADFHLGDGSDGLAQIGRLRRHFGGDIPAMVVTSDRTPELRARVKAEQIPMLSKPIVPAKLRSLIIHLLDSDRG